MNADQQTHLVARFCFELRVNDVLLQSMAEAVMGPDNKVEGTRVGGAGDRVMHVKGMLTVPTQAREVVEAAGAEGVLDDEHSHLCIALVEQSRMWCLIDLRRQEVEQMRS